MRGFIKVFKRELKNFTSDRFIFFTAILAPVFFSLIIMFVFVNRIATDLPVAV